MPLEIDEGVITRALEVLYPEGIKENSRVVKRQRHPRKSAVKECTPRRVPERLQCSHNLETRANSCPVQVENLRNGV